MKNKKQIIILSSFVAGFIFLLAIFIGLLCGIKDLKTSHSPVNISSEQEIELQAKLDELFPARTLQLKDLPYVINTPELNIAAKSCILIDTTTGNVIYEKNADMLIPPASMTKLVEMYVVFEAIEKGEFSFDDIVPLPKESWAINLPRDASIMFLAEGQKVTIRELLLGLSIASGNDASIAVAQYVAGNMEAFVERMNRVIKNLGLEKTHFVESSGYDARNVTTAREFAAFAQNYVNRFPFALEEFHSQKILKYPLQHNLPKAQQYQGDGQAIIQYNTNKLLGKLEGCDGLKTGFIYESGFNLSLTAQRNGIRFLSVTMKGPGIGGVEGNKYRVQDATNLMEYAFANFADFIPSVENRKLKVNICGGKQKALYLIPAEKEAFTVPYITGASPSDTAKNICIQAKIPKCILGKIDAGTPYGTLTYTVKNSSGEDVVLRTIPLVADRNVDTKKGPASLWYKSLYYLSGMNK